VLADRYALKELIAHGGMADVYRATDQLLRRQVAVKMLRDVPGGAADRLRFAAEAQTLARLSHPGLVTVLDAGASDSQPYLVMELIEGSSLADCAGRTLDADRVTEIGRQVADALAYAHAAGVVHRDVKPGNVLLGPDGRVWLADFGIARLLADTARHTSTGLVIGTASYLSPEQAQGVAVTPASDVYSLGLVLLEALTGTTAYPGAGVESAVARLGRAPEIPEHLPGGWRRLLSEMTAMSPADRPSAVDVAERLRDVRTADEEPTTPLAVPATRLLTEPLPTMPPQEESPGLVVADGRRRWVWIAAAVAAVGALAVLITLQLHGGASGADRVRMPSDVPQRLEQPLRQLHDAVNGETP
jgi:serine/threonine protein kinase